MYGMAQITVKRALLALSQFESIKDVVSYGVEYERAIEALESLVQVAEGDMILVGDQICHVIYWINEFSFMSEVVHVKQVSSDS
jgi:hypothetical protein